ncbi:YciI family protein [Actinomadura rugatobispora]|uniref:YciI family protein n=1 Tax=Actinomadura rugatobispora TaxID=1994 RepID=A0ABW1A243_9ACTN|nr:YciI family protein [Actinomadura rugatobispora]
MQHYLLSIYQPAGPAPSPEFLEPIMREVGRVNEEMHAAGAWVFAGGLHAPETATVVRTKDGEPLLTDGPFTEGKEVLGGLTVIRAEDLDAALEWGRKLSRATTLPVEVRPFQDGSH